MTHRRTAVLVGAFIVGLSLTSPAASATESVNTPTAASSQRMATTTAALTPTQFQNRLFSRLNARRASIGCPAVVNSSALGLAARRHTTRMIEDRMLSHQVPNELSLGPRVTRAGYTNWRFLGETLGVGATTPAGMFRSWVNSPPHREIMDNCTLRSASFGVYFTNGNVAWATGDYGHR